MAEETRHRRAEMHRLEQQENKKYRGFLGFSIFILVSVTFMMMTFMNPDFMKNQIAKDSNIAVVNRTINNRFDNFAESVGADRQSDRNLLNSSQTLPIAEEIADYALGVHGFRTDTDVLAQNIQKILVQKIDDNSSTEVKDIQRLINKSKRTSQYAIANGFDLGSILVLANGITVGWIAGILIIILSLIMILSIVKKLTKYFAAREIVHNFFGSSMWAATFIILIYGVISTIPSFINVENVFGSGFGVFLELGSGIFLELVIVGAALFIISIIPWAASKRN